MKLVTMMAKACSYAQEHIDDAQCWPIDDGSRETMLQVVSFQMACFFAQNTKDGDGGVDWDIIMYELVEHPGKTEKHWKEILNRVANLYGGWK